MSEHPNIPATPQPSTPPLAGDQPPRSRHRRHGRDRALLPRRPRRPAGGDDRHAGVPPLLLRVRRRSARWRSSSTRDTPIEPFAKPAGVPDPRAVQFDHLSFNLPDEEALLDLRDRLKSAGCEVTDVVDHGVHPLDLLHRPQRHRARGVVVGRSTPPADRPTTATPRCSPTPTRCPPCESSPSRASWPQCPRLIWCRAVDTGPHGGARWCDLNERRHGWQTACTR